MAIISLMISSASCAWKRFAKIDRKSTRLNSSHSQISYAVFCLKKKKIQIVYLHPHYIPTPTAHRETPLDAPPHSLRHRHSSQTYISPLTYPRRVCNTVASLSSE